MVEWDQDIPEFDVVYGEALKAAEYRERARLLHPERLEGSKWCSTTDALEVA
jgi:hypothetical protein